MTERTRPQLSIQLAPDVVNALKFLADQQGVTITDTLGNVLKGPDQSSADDAEKWRAVTLAWHDAEYAEDWWQAKAVINEAIRQGLVPRKVDPADPNQVQVVMDALTSGTPFDVATCILEALADLLNGHGHD